MKKIVSGILIFFYIICSVYSASPGENQVGMIDENRILRVDEYLSNVNEAYHVPGMAFFITDSEKTLFSKSYGQCESMDEQFFIGSESKSFTALCIMQLVEKGLVDLEEDISHYLPEFRFSKKVSVRSLLNQTSGFDEHMKLRNVKISDSYGRFEYSNVNYDLLGKIVESVSGMSYADYVSENIFNPLGMTSSSADSSKVKGSDRLLTGNRNYFGFFVRGDADYPKKNSWFHEPAGFICTTPSDFQKYLRMYLNGGVGENGNQIVQNKSINSMWYENVRTMDPSKVSESYGMGWFYNRTGNVACVYHAGLVENYTTYMLILPNKDLAISFKINGNDYFGMNRLMENVVPGVVSILLESSSPKIAYTDYVRDHFILDAIYLLFFLISVPVLIRALKAKRKSRVRNFIALILWSLVWPIFLLYLTQIFFKTPLWVVKSYVPDLYVTIITCSLISFFGGFVRLGKMLSGKCNKT